MDTCFVCAQLTQELFHQHCHRHEHMTAIRHSVHSSFVTMVHTSSTDSQTKYASTVGLQEAWHRWLVSTTNNNSYAPRFGMTRRACR
jgi:hypothetical protein